jgi:predicted 3-demethylubiquinone-9 3-methyltransferase (glyoxalase superfamily)
MNAFTTCLWFDTEGEEAARFYAEIFPSSSVGKVTPYAAGERAGQTMTVDFVLNGSKFVALNGGPSSGSTNRSRSRCRARTRLRSIVTGPC